MANTKWKWFSSSAENFNNGRRERPMIYKVIDNIVPDKRHKGKYKTEQKYMNPHIPSELELLKTQLKLNNIKPTKPERNRKKAEESDE